MLVVRVLELQPRPSGLVALRPVASHHSGAAQGRTKLLPSWPGHDEEKEIALDGLELTV